MTIQGYTAAGYVADKSRHKFTNGSGMMKLGWTTCTRYYTNVHDSYQRVLRWLPSAIPSLTARD